MREKRRGENGKRKRREIGRNEERGGREKGERVGGGLERRIRKGESLKRARRDQTAPFIVGWAIR